MISRTLRSVKSKTLSTKSTSVSSMRPWRWLSSMSRRISSSVWASSPSEAVWKPMRCATQLATWFSSQTNGYMTRWKTSIGRATLSMIFSTFWMAIVFGVNSPSTMCRPVMIEKASASEIVWPMTSSSPMACVIGRISVATAGSPTQPRPSEASVMPSCVTERDASRWSVSFLAYFA